MTEQPAAGRRRLHRFACCRWAVGGVLFAAGIAGAPYFACFGILYFLTMLSLLWLMFGPQYVDWAEERFPAGVGQLLIWLPRIEIWSYMGFLLFVTLVIVGRGGGSAEIAAFENFVFGAAAIAVAAALTEPVARLLGR